MDIHWPIYQRLEPHCWDRWSAKKPLVCDSWVTVNTLTSGGDLESTGKQKHWSINILSNILGSGEIVIIRNIIARGVAKGDQCTGERKQNLW